jgi:uncharacterized membrane protein YczE
LKKRFSSKKFTLRLLVYVGGIVVLALGIDMNTKALLGVSPVISIAYNISVITGIKLGIMTFIYYGVLILIQLAMRGRDFPPHQFMQILMSFGTSFFIQIFDDILPVGETWLQKGIMLAAAIVITGIGASLTVGMHTIPNPADGLASIIGMKLGRNFGFGKNVLDLSCIGVALAIGLIFEHSLLGISVGTVIAMIFTGRVIALVQKTTDRIYRAVSEDDPLYGKKENNEDKKS